MECTPLYHGVVLERSLALGLIGWAALGHATYLAVMGVGGLSLAGRRIGHLLLG